MGALMEKFDQLGLRTTIDVAWMQQMNYSEALALSLGIGIGDLRSS